MQKLLRGYAPLGVMAGLTIWCCWTQLRDTAPLIAATNDDKLPRIERETLRPQVSAVTARDAFRQSLPEASLPDVVVNQPATLLPVEPTFDPKTVLPSLRLDATLMGDNRVSVINGRVYGEGDTIKLDEFPEVQCRLQTVRSRSVFVKINTATFELHYGAPPKTTSAEADLGTLVNTLPSLAELGQMINSALGEGAPHVESVQLGNAMERDARPPEQTPQAGPAKKTDSNR